MAHRFPIKEIARQSGLSPATIDRVLNNRVHVSMQTRNRVLRAIEELKRQEQQLAATGRNLFVDILIEAPTRFSREVRRAVDIALPRLGMSVFRPRFVTQDVMTETETVAALDRIAKRGSQGVCLKARDIQPVRAAVDRLLAKGIPVVTLVTDMPQTRRSAYAGLDNAGAGRTAAYLMDKSLPGNTGHVLATRSQDSFYGEAERFAHFKEELQKQRSDVTVIDVVGTAGLDTHLKLQLEALNPSIKFAGVYSMGGGNAATLAALKDKCVNRLVYVAHDLDVENRRLLAAKSIDFVLHHDLAIDIENAFKSIAAFHRITSAMPDKLISDIQIITPCNLPR